MKITLLSGGLGDVLLHTPLFKFNFERKMKKMNVFVLSIHHFDLLCGNPYINLFLCKTECNSMPTIIKSSLLNDDEYALFLKKYTSNKIKKTFIRKNYADLMPSISCDEMAAKIIAKMHQSDITNIKCDIFLTDEEKNTAKHVIDKLRYAVCINPSSTYKIKEWDIYKWEKIINLYPNINFIQIGSPEECKIKGTLDFRNYPLRYQLGILSFSNFFIGLDSFWNHASFALNIKSIILFGPSSPKIWGNFNSSIIYKKTNCSPCLDWLHYNQCPYGKKCMNNIQILDVKKAIDELILKSVSGFGV
jgi:ADP-heptose:LPS heptosyltransferase